MFTGVQLPYDIMSKTQTSLTGSVPVLPPKTTRNGFIKAITCPYRLPGVIGWFDFIDQTARSSPARILSMYRLSSARSPPT